MLHFMSNERFYVLELRTWHLEYELVVHLKQHLGVQGTSRERLVDANHRNLDQVSRGPLNRRVGRRALAECTDVEIPIAELGDISPSIEDGLHVAMFPSELHHRIQIFANAMKALEILIDEFLRFGVSDLQLS